MMLHEDLGNLDKAREKAEEIMAFGKKMPQIFALEIGSERVMLELMTTNRKEVIEQLWTKQMQTYTKASSKYSPMKLAVLCAVEMIMTTTGKRPRHTTGRLPTTSTTMLCQERQRRRWSLRDISSTAQKTKKQREAVRKACQCLNYVTILGTDYTDFTDKINKKTVKSV